MFKNIYSLIILIHSSSKITCTPISFALGWPHRLANPAPSLNLQEIGNLTFEDPDVMRFPALRLAREALKEGGSAPTVLNAANEIAVEGFLNERINFLEKDAHLSIVNLVISVKDRIHLAAVIKKIRTIKGVNRTLRARN